MKIQQKVKINQNSELLVLFENNDSSVKKLIKSIPEKINKLENFYKINLPKTTIEFVYSREDFDQKIGSETPEWMVGFTRGNKIYLFSPQVIEKESTHKKAEVEKILIHEICHIFNHKINKRTLRFFDEGVALYLADQEKPKPKKFDYKKIKQKFFKWDISSKQFAENDGYQLSYWFVRKVVEKYSKNKILNLLKTDPRKIGRIINQL